MVGLLITSLSKSTITSKNGVWEKKIRENLWNDFIVGILDLCTIEATLNLKIDSLGLKYYPLGLDVPKP